MAKPCHWVIDVHRNAYGPMSRADAREYARLWDRDTPDDAPHRVERRTQMRGQR